jgi:uncharacterized protein YqeY
VNAAGLKERLRADLKGALQARESGKVSVVRTLIAALDNAEAVEVEQGPYHSRAFGDPGGEVARRELDVCAIHAVLEREAASRVAAAEGYERHGRPEDAARLRAEAALVQSYSAAFLQN